jgi:hypothetical protein
MALDEVTPTPQWNPDDAHDGDPDKDHHNRGRRAKDVRLPSWRYRRKMIFLTLLFCAACVIYIMVWGADTRVNETIVLGCFMLAGSVVGVYVGGATWEDIRLEHLRANM